MTVWDKIHQEIRNGHELMHGDLRVKEIQKRTIVMEINPKDLTYTIRPNISSLNCDELRDIGALCGIRHFTFNTFVTLLIDEGEIDFHGISIFAKYGFQITCEGKNCTVHNLSIKSDILHETHIYSYTGCSFKVENCHFETPNIVVWDDLFMPEGNYALRCDEIKFLKPIPKSAEEYICPNNVRGVMLRNNPNINVFRVLYYLDGSKKCMKIKMK